MIKKGIFEWIDQKQKKGTVDFLWFSASSAENVAKTVGMRVCGALGVDPFI